LDMKKTLAITFKLHGCKGCAISAGNATTSQCFLKFVFYYNFPPKLLNSKSCLWQTPSDLSIFLFNTYLYFYMEIMQSTKRIIYDLNLMSGIQVEWNFLKMSFTCVTFVWHGLCFKPFLVKKQPTAWYLSNFLSIDLLSKYSHLFNELQDKVDKIAVWNKFKSVFQSINAERSAQ
jgi:hypothetical protein